MQIDTYGIQNIVDRQDGWIMTRGLRFKIITKKFLAEIEL